jgi:hypothetical protein
LTEKSGTDQKKLTAALYVDSGDFDANILRHTNCGSKTVSQVINLILTVKVRSTHVVRNVNQNSWKTALDNGAFGLGINGLVDTRDPDRE